MTVPGLHARWPGITEDLLGVAGDDEGRTCYDWLAELLPDSGAVLDLCCGSAPLAAQVGVGRYLGVDSSPEELAVAAARRPRATTINADVMAVDIDGPFAAVAVSMALMLLPLAAVLSRCRDWLCADAVLAATVPMRSPTLDGTAYNRLLSALGWQGEPFVEPLDRLAERAAELGFAVRSDEVRCFAVPIARPADRERLLRSFYLPRGGVEGARDLLLAEVAAGRRTLGYPIRRVGLRPVG